MEEWVPAMTQQKWIIKLMSLIHQIFQHSILTLILTLLVFLFLYKKKRVPVIHLPPSPMKLPIIGHLHLLRSSMHQSFHRLSIKYGPVILLKLGRWPTVVVSSAEAAKDVMKTYDAECATRPPLQGIKALTYNRLDVAFSPYSDYSREVKKLFVLEIFGKNRPELFATARENKIERLMESIGKSNSSPINLENLFFLLMDGIIGTVALGRTYGADHFRGHEFRDLFVDVTNVLGSISAEDIFPSAVIGRLIDKLTGVTALRKRTLEKLDAFFDKIIDKHSDPARHVVPGQEDLVDVLLRNWGEQQSSLNLTKDHIKAMIFDTYIGGIDTTCLTLLWAMTEMVRNPRVMDRLQNEIRNAVGKNKLRVKAEDLESVPYLKMVVKEIMRLHPAIPLLLPRMTTAPIKIGTYDVLPDTMIHVNVWAIGRDPNFWDNPEEFYPERFENTEVDFRGSDFQYIPFGAGKRMCPGYRLAIATVELALANLLYRFNWELPYGMTVYDLSMEEAGSTAYCKKTPVELVPTIHIFHP